MLRIKSIFVILLLSLILIGCENNNNVIEDLKQEQQDDQIELGDLSSEVNEQHTIVSISIDKEVYTLPIDRLGLTLENKSENSIEFGSPIHIDKLQDGKWIQIPYKDNFGFTMEGHILKPGESSVHQIVLDYLNHELSSGKYRVRKSIRVGTKEFAIADIFETKN